MLKKRFALKIKKQLSYMWRVRFKYLCCPVADLELAYIVEYSPCVMPLSWIINMNAIDIMLQVLATSSCM